MKQIGSVITGSATAKAWSIGEQPGATGSGGQALSNVAASAPTTTLPDELKIIVPDSVQHWMNLPPETMPWDLDHHSLEELQAAAADLAHAHQGVERALPPVSKEKIANVIGAIAEMLQVSVPSETGLKLYLHALKGMPGYKFEAAAMKLIKTHKWPRLPLPADFIEAAKDERQDIDIARIKIQSARMRVESAVRLLHQRSK